MGPTDRPVLGVDFDGVIHSYSTEWKGANVASDPPVLGAMKFLADAVNHFDVNIFSSRNWNPLGILCMDQYIRYYLCQEYQGDGLEIADQLKYPTYKPAFHLLIDDHGYHFNGTFPTMEEIINFKQWNNTPVWGN